MLWLKFILGDPGADSGGEGKSKRAGKNGAKKSEERGEKSVLASDICKKTFGFFCPIRRQQAYESSRVSLHGMTYEAQLLAMFV